MRIAGLSIGVAVGWREVVVIGRPTVAASRPGVLRGSATGRRLRRDDAASRRIGRDPRASIAAKDRVPGTFGGWLRQVVESRGLKALGRLEESSISKYLIQGPVLELK
jgi:hypothetical protein